MISEGLYMASLLDHIDYLSKEIGARPAGTEEEQQAALYIAEQFQKEASFPATIEEFTSSSNLEGANAILAVVTFVVTVLAMLFTVLTIPAFILATAAAAIYALEAFDKPILSRALARGASQNVVAKYQPFAQDANKSGRGRSRKVVLVAHYDTSKVTPAVVQRVQSTGLPVGLICVGGMIAAALLLLIRIFAGSPDGFGGVLLLVLTILVLVVVLVPIVKAVLYHLAPYNEGANNNASGVAAIIEVARRISRGSVSEADLAAGADGVTIHGEAAAIENGLVPEGAQIVYEAEQLKPPEEIGEYDEEERLLSAKAAIAALTGKPVERKVYGSVADRLVNSRAHALPDEEPSVADEALQDGQATESGAEGFDASPDKSDAVQNEAVESAVEPSAAQVEEPQAEIAGASGFENAPSWFIAAQKNAKRSPGETGPIQRSRYTEAIDRAEQNAAERERMRAEEERLRAEEDRRAREEAARAAIVAAHIGEPQEEVKGHEEELAPAPDEVVDPAPVAEEPALDPGSTVAYAPVSLDEIKRDMEAQEQQEESSFIAPPEEFSMPSRRFELPKIEDKPAVAENTSPSRSGLLRRLRTDVPSLSGIIRMQAAGEDVSQKPQEEDPLLKIDMPEIKLSLDPELDGIDTIVNDVDYDMEVPLSADGDATTAIAPTPYEEILDEAGLDDYAEEPEPRRSSSNRPSRRTRTTARSSARRGEPVDYEPNEMEMPSSRAGGFFSRLLGKKNEELDETPQEWLDVDEDFDARTVGRERGGWESFRDDQYDEDFDQYDDFDDGKPAGRWNGGSFSRVRLGHVDMRSGEGSDADEQDPLIEPLEDQAITEDIEQIYHFRNPLFNTEVWFVAIGSDTDLHDGARAFVAEHRDELRGSMVVEVESLGLGELAFASEEGRYRKLKASSRVKRYMRQATAATGISPSSVSLSGSDSITTVLQKAGCQTMHLFGEEGGRPALKGSADDVLENVDELTLDENVNFLLELVKRG